MISTSASVGDSYWLIGGIFWAETIHEIMAIESLDATPFLHFGFHVEMGQQGWLIISFWKEVEYKK